MVWVWVVLTLFVLWTLGISLMRHETTPRALWEAIIRQRGVWRPCFLARAVRPSCAKSILRYRSQLGF
jgi:hypothetical protein